MSAKLLYSIVDNQQVKKVVKLASYRQLYTFYVLFLVVGTPHLVRAQENMSNSAIEKALSMASKYEAEGDFKEATRYINEAGITAWENKDYLNAIDYFNRSIELNSKINNESGISKLQSNLGMIYTDMRQYKNSLNYFQLALDYRLVYGQRTEIISTYINVAVVLNNLKRYEEAAKNLEKALTIATEMNDAAQMKSCYGMLAETYERAGNNEKMIHYFNLYKTFHEMIQRNKVNKAQKQVESEHLHALQVELERKEKELQLIAANKELEQTEEELSNLSLAARELYSANSKQELAISLLESENKLDKSIIRANKITQGFQRKIILISIAGLVILILLVLVLYRNYRYKKQVNIQLVSQNKKIIELNDNLEARVKNRTRELEITMQQLERKNKDLDEFSHVISHNLRAPVATILGLNEIIDTKNPGAPTNLKIFSHLAGVVKNLDEIVKDLSIILEVRDAISLPFKNVEVNKVLDAVKVQLQQSISKSKITINFDDSEAPVVRTVESYFDNILYNLLSNAIKYRSLKHPKVKIKTRRVDAGFKMIVADNGIGISEEHLSKIFMPYKQFANTEEGKGLGLYLVHVQIEALGGEINVSSKLKVGTTFEIILPDNTTN